MGSSAEAIETEALTLPAEERVRLALHLLESIESRPCGDPATIEKAWLAESQRRYQAYLDGKEEAVSAGQAFADLRKDDH